MYKINLSDAMMLDTRENILNEYHDAGWSINVYHHQGKDKFVDGAMNISVEDALLIDFYCVWLSK